jgi:cobalt-zinc-cadmium efflux system protein
MPHSHSHAHDKQHQTQGGHSHHHSHHHAPAKYDRAFLIGLFLNGGFVTLEFILGIMANSIALVADAGHNLSDVLGLVLAWGATLLARRLPSNRYTYGWRKSSILAAFLNAVFLLVVTGGIAWEAIHRLAEPSAVAEPLVIGVATIGILINTGTALLFLSGRKHDLNLRAAFLHMAADAVVSLGVALSGVVILVTHWFWLDPAFSLVISAVIIWSTLDLLRESFSLAIDAVPTNVDVRAVELYLAERPGVEEVHDLHIWGMSTTETALTAHLVMPSGHPGDGFLSQLGQELHDHFGVEHTTIQIEAGGSECVCSLGSRAKA